MTRKKIKWETVFFALTVTLFWSETLMACHRGGPMGFADNDPGAFSLDVSSSPTYIAASTLGTAGCKNWDYAGSSKEQPNLCKDIVITQQMITLADTVKMLYNCSGSFPMVASPLSAIFANLFLSVPFISN